MLSVHSRTRTKCCPYLYWKQYSEALDRKSRNCASLFLSVFFVLLLFCMAFFTDRTVSLPAGRQKTVLVFRAVQESVYQKTPADMKKLLAETSAVSVPLEADISKRSESVREMPKAAESEKKVSEKTSLPPQKREQAKQKTVSSKSAVQPEKADRTAEEKSGIQSSAAQNMSHALGSSIPDRAEHSKILAVLMQHIEKHKVYPRQARRSGAEGRCRLKITVEGGKVKAALLEQKSGKRVLDVACEKLGTALLGLDVGVNKDVTVIVPVRYSLSE